MRYLFAYAFLLMTTLVIHGQERGINRDRAPEVLEQLDLSPLQKEKIDALRLKYKDLFDHAVRTTPNREARMEKRKALQRDLRTEMRSILTPTQQRRFRELNRQRLEQQGKPGIQESINWVEPSAEQQAKIEVLLNEQKIKVKALRQQALPVEERREKIGEIKRETILSLKNILSEEQFNKFQKHVNNRIRGSHD